MEPTSPAITNGNSSNSKAVRITTVSDSLLPRVARQNRANSARAMTATRVFPTIAGSSENITVSSMTYFYADQNKYRDRGPQSALSHKIEAGSLSQATAKVAGRLKSGLFEPLDRSIVLASPALGGRPRVHSIERQIGLAARPDKVVGDR